MKIKQNQLRSEIITVICTLLLLGTTLLVSPHLTQPAQQIISSQSPPHHSVATTEVWPTYAHDAAHSGYTSGIGPMTNQTFLQKQLLTDTSFMYTVEFLEMEIYISLVKQDGLIIRLSSDVLQQILVNSFGRTQVSIPLPLEVRH